MSWVYGRSSSAARDSCDPWLIQVINRGLEISPVDISIIWGFRNRLEQNAMFRMRTSQVEWPDSTHNFMERGVPRSRAFDFGPYVNGGIPWDDTHLFGVVAGVFFCAAKLIGDERYCLGWGGDWDMDGLTTDQKFMDWGHMEMRRVE